MYIVECLRSFMPLDATRAPAAAAITTIFATVTPHRPNHRTACVCSSTQPAALHTTTRWDPTL